MPAKSFSHAECDHPSTSEARQDCRKKRLAAGEGLSNTPAQIRKRARRYAKKADAEMEKLYKKPVEEWDWEELAHGKPRNKDGDFKGNSPKWVTRAVHEEAIRRFNQMLNAKVRVVSSPALDVLMNLMLDQQLVYNDEGEAVRYIVPPSVKSQIAQYLVDRVGGKPTQTIESKADVQVQLQSILAGSVVNPGQVVEIDEVEEEDDNDDDDEETQDDDSHKLIVKRSQDERDN